MKKLISKYSNSMLELILKRTKGMLSLKKPIKNRRIESYTKNEIVQVHVDGPMARINQLKDGVMVVKQMSMSDYVKKRVKESLKTHPGWNFENWLSAQTDRVDAPKKYANLITRLILEEETNITDRSQRDLYAKWLETELTYTAYNSLHRTSVKERKQKKKNNLGLSVPETKF